MNSIRSYFSASILKLSFPGLILLLLSWNGSENTPPKSGFEALNFRGQDFLLYHVNLNTDSLAFFWQDEKGHPLRSLGKLESWCHKKNLELLFATNGGMYLEDRSPQGWYVANGKELKPANTRKEGYGNFYMQPNGIFAITSEGPQIGPTDKLLHLKQPIQWATQSGPLLVINDTIHPAFREGSTNLYIRSGVGITGPNQLVFVISELPVNFYDFALLFKEKLGCRNALYLDGAISRMHLPTANHPDKGGNFGCMIGVIKPNSKVKSPE